MHDNLPAYAKGVLGEAAVCDRLTDGGMELLERRFRSPFGEIDLIMLDGDVVAFVEVKLRSGAAIYTPEEAVTPLKQQKIVKAAMQYLQLHPSDLQPRFDVIAIVADDRDPMKARSLEHLKAAFDVGGMYAAF